MTNLEMTARPLDLIGVGECMVEFHATEPLGEAATLVRGYGGDVLNALVSAARLGSRTGFVTRVGRDPFGRGLLRAWRDERIDTTHAPLVDGENGVYFISLSAGGEREFTYRRRDSAAAGLTVRDVRSAYVAGSRALLLSGITQALSQGARTATLHAARLARNAGTLVAYDPNYRPALWASLGGISAARAAYEELLPLVDLLLPSFPADSVLVDRLATNNPPTNNPTNQANAARSFAPPGVLVAMKAGKDGAWLHVNGSVAHFPADSDVEVVDTTGAGDAWNGAFLHAVLAGRPPEWAARFANVTAARKLRYRGAIPPHSLSESFS